MVDFVFFVLLRQFFLVFMLKIVFLLQDSEEATYVTFKVGELGIASETKSMFNCWNTSMILYFFLSTITIRST